MKYLTIFILMVLVTTSCSKDKRSARKLEGNWQLVKKEVNGNSVSIDGLTVVFEFGEFINSKTPYPGFYREKKAQNNVVNQIVLPIHTLFSDKGKTFTIDYDYGSNTEIYNVIELNKKSLVLQYKDSENVYYFDPID